MKPRPLGDRIIVKPILLKEKTKSGIILSDITDKEINGQAEIVFIGNGEEVKKLNLKKGDRVLIRRWGGEEINVKGEKHKILKIEEVFSIIEK